MFKVSTLALVHARRRVHHCLTVLSINVLIHFVPSCQDTCTQFVNVLDPLLVDLLLHYRPHFVVSRIYIQALVGMKYGVSILSSSTVSRALLREVTLPDIAR